MIERANGDLHDHQAPEARGQRGQSGAQVGGVREHDHIGLEPLAVRLEELGEVGRPDLLLALDEELDVERGRACALEPGAQRGEVEQQSGLVVHDAATVESAVAPVGRLEGWALPALLAPGRLHVVMGVDQNRGRVSRPEPFTDDVGVSAGELQDLDAVELDRGEERGHRIGRALDLTRVKPRRGDTRDARKVAQLDQRAIDARLELARDLRGQPSAHGQTVA